jgi:hypothetical protein
MGLHALTLLDMLNATCDAAERLGEAAAEAFREHPDYEVITSFPGSVRRVVHGSWPRSATTAPGSPIPGPSRAYAGSAPVTRASGRSIVITRRRIKNDRLATASWIWAFASLTHSPGARKHHDRRRTAGDRHAAALRHLSNRFLGQLHHCLVTGQNYSETAAFR